MPPRARPRKRSRPSRAQAHTSPRASDPSGPSLDPAFPSSMTDDGSRPRARLGTQGVTGGHMNEPIWALDACEIADRVRDGDVSAKEVLESFLERIEARNPELNAFVHVDADGARAQAAAIDRALADGDEVGS